METSLSEQGDFDGGELELSGESSLTPLQREVITELQKILFTLNQINDSLLKAVARKGDVEKAQKEAVVKGKGVFGGVLGREEMEEGE